MNILMIIATILVLAVCIMFIMAVLTFRGKEGRENTWKDFFRNVFALFILISLALLAGKAFHIF
ncbi:MAG: hypothetical protein JWR50_422 [Mucilaginibacter sp.]|nr:hypothetical protein [Mucilaginibacter sp.]